MAPVPAAEQSILQLPQASSKPSSQASSSGQTSPSPHVGASPAPEQSALQVPQASSKPSSQVSKNDWVMPSPQLPSRSQVTEHPLPSSNVFPSSQSSPVSKIPLPQIGGQSLSTVSLQAGPQQPSLSSQATTGWLKHTRLQVSSLPVKLSTVQAFASSQLEAQLPSQVSPKSTIPSPHVVEQSLSSSGSQPEGQQPSLLAQTSTTL